jgi:hypothetical protein
VRLLVSPLCLYSPKIAPNGSINFEKRKGKMVEGDDGQFLKKCKVDLLEICYIYSSYLDIFMVQISQSIVSWFGRYQQINLGSIYGKMLA